MKKKWSRSLALVMVAIMMFVALPSMVFASDDISVTIDGQAVIFEGQGPIIQGGRTLVPVRGVFEALGFYPTWDGTARAATLTRADFVVVLTIGSYTFTTNGEEFSLDVPAQMIAGRTLLPLRAVLESVGYDDMDWVPATRTVVIHTGANAQPTPPPPPTPDPSPTPTPTPQPTPTPVPGRVNINTANLEQLQTIPGVGPVIAQRIIDARPFARVDDLIRVTGIGAVTLDRMLPYITVD